MHMKDEQIYLNEIELANSLRADPSDIEGLREAGVKITGVGSSAARMKIVEIRTEWQV